MPPVVAESVETARARISALSRNLTQIQRVRANRRIMIILGDRGVRPQKTMRGRTLDFKPDRPAGFFLPAPLRTRVAPD